MHVLISILCGGEFLPRLFLGGDQKPAKDLIFDFSGSTMPSSGFSDREDSLLDLASDSEASDFEDDDAMGC